MGVSGFGIPGAFNQGIDKVKEEIAGLEKQRQELYGHIGLKDKIKRLEDEIQALQEQKITLTQEIESLVDKKASDLKEEIASKTKIQSEKLEDINQKIVIGESQLKDLGDRISSSNADLLLLQNKIATAGQELRDVCESTDKYVLDQKNKIEESWQDISQKNKELNTREAFLDKGLSGLLADKRAFAEEKDKDLKSYKETCKAIEKDKAVAKNMVTQAEVLTKKSDDYHREKLKEIALLEAALSTKQKDLDEKEVLYKEKQEIVTGAEKQLNKDMDDLKTNWDIFREAQQNLERRNLKIKDREDKVKKKMSELGISYNG